MKRKLRYKNKLYYTLVLKKGSLYNSIVRDQSGFNQLIKNSHKYNESMNPLHATEMFSGSRMISVPVLLHAKCKKSRIQGKLQGYRVFTSLDAFNEHFKVSFKMEDIICNSESI